MARRPSNGAKNPDRGRTSAPGHPRRRGVPPSAELSWDSDVVRAMYRAIEARDLEALTGLVDPGVRWIDPLVARLPFDGTRRGLAPVLRAAFRLDEGGAGPLVSAGTFVEFGDGVLVVGRLLTGGDAGDPFVHECSVRNGRVISIRGYRA